MFIDLGCEGKVPQYFPSVVEKITYPDCTYHFVLNVTMEYDPIVLDDVDILVVRVTRDSNTFLEFQSFFNPFNTVSTLIVL